MVRYAGHRGVGHRRMLVEHLFNLAQIPSASGVVTDNYLR